MPAPFHEVLFPLDIALKSSGGPERLTDIVTLGSGREERNTRWAHSRRRYDAGYGVKTLDELRAVLAFFEERRGRLYGFRWRDRLDGCSAVLGTNVSPLDQPIGEGDGARADFPLTKTYGGAYAPYARPIVKPLADSVRIAVAGIESAPAHFDCDAATGLVTFVAGHVPPPGAAVTAGFRFDVPVRFDTDFLEVDLSAFAAGAIPKIPLIEIRP
ncbi:MAG: TIGR02217 family protein [Xanthobacteraceae bacterium]|nr:MAG: TIGR02217 family protein [Xanthobacteraceae bacterium]